ncbi:MAG: InlB B-repeat-containing protein, partial [Sphaerochaetaceae bacterium]|nr:InlB B-repeat-containing protein [Sphaerochaetaceae bacterium]
MKRKYTLLVLTILLLSIVSISAQAVKEKIPVVTAEDFQALDVENASLETISDTLTKARAYYADQVNTFKENMTKAIEEKDAQSYYEARNSLYNLQYPKVSKTQTEALVIRIANSEQEDAKELASWLYNNSSYYRPSLTMTYESSSTNRTYYYKNAISMEPGTTVTLPNVKATTTDGIFMGWGLTNDEVMYPAGSEITMPYVDQTLYAIFQEGVRFTDDLTNTDVFCSKEAIELPVVIAPNDGYVFLGWFDSYGKEFDPDAEINGSATYSARWENITITNVGTKYYKDLTIPANQQVELQFSITNDGTVALGSLSISLVNNNDSLKVLSNNLNASSIKVGETKSGSFRLYTTADSGSTLPLSLKVTDA